MGIIKLWALEEISYQGIQYIINEEDKTAKVTYRGGYDSSYSSWWYSGSVVVPSSITYNGEIYNVTSFGYGAFHGCRLTSLTIPSSITSIDNEAFLYSHIDEFHIESIESWCGVEFASASAHPFDLYTYSRGGKVFCGEEELVSLVIPQGVKEIKRDVFKFFTSIKSVTIPNSVTSIGYNAFEGCDGIEELHIESIESWCKAAITCHPFSSSNGGKIFVGDEEVSSLDIPYGVSEINRYAFYKCSELSSVVIPNSVTTINDYAFSECNSLISITIPNSVTEIGKLVFQNCRELKEVNYNAEKCTSMGNITNRNIQSIFDGCNSLSTINIGSNVQVIPAYAFYNCENVRSIIIPSSIKEIGRYAFNSVFKAFFLTNTKPQIDDYAFHSCKIYYTANEDKYHLKIKYDMWDTDDIPHKIYPLLSSMFEVDGLRYIPTSMSQRTCDLVDVNYLDQSINSNIGPKVIYINSSGRQYEFTICNINMYSGYSCNAFSDLVLKNNGCIEEYAFALSNMSSIEIDNNITSIGEHAFAHCENARNIAIGDGVTYIGEYCFDSCTSIDRLNIGKSITNISKGCYTNCTNLKCIDFNDVIESIGDEAFMNCSTLASLSIPANVIEIGTDAFTGCTSINDLRIEDSEIPIKLYCCFKGGKTLYLGRNIKQISTSSFQENQSIEKVITNNNVTFIPEKLFFGCSNLKEIELAETVVTINKLAFAGCTNLETLTIPVRLKLIGAEAFSGCAKIEYLRIPASVEQIETKAFDGCISLRNVLFEGSDTEIKLACLFRHVKSLYLGRNIKYETSWKSDYKSAFEGNDVLEQVLVNEKVTRINDFEFYNCTNLKDININDYGVITSIGRYAFANNVSLETNPVINFPIGDMAFSGCESLKEIEFGSSIKTLGEGCFEGCKSIEDIKLGEKISSIGDNCFANCIRLKSFDFNNKIESIGREAFMNCTSLSNLNIPESLLKIGWRAFDGCLSIDTLLFEDSKIHISLDNHFESGKYLYLGRDILYNDYSGYNSPFSGNDVVEKVETNIYFTKIPSYCFYNCKNLKDVFISNAVTTIGQYAFSGDASLERFEVGKSIESIGAEAFSDCIALREFISHSLTPAAVGTEALDDINKMECILRVPEGTEAAYTAAEQWKEFWIEGNLSPCYTVEVAVDENSIGMGTVTGSGCYDENSEAIIEAIPDEWHEFLEWSDGNSDNPRVITVNGDVNINAKFLYKYYINTQPTDNNIFVGLNETIPGILYEWYVSDTPNGTDEDITDDIQSVEGYYGWNKDENEWISGNSYFNNTVARMATVVSVKSGERLTFNYYVSSEEYYDYLQFTLGDKDSFRKYGINSGSYEYTFSHDTNISLIFDYKKNEQKSKGADQARISNVILHRNPTLLDGITSNALQSDELEINKYYYCKVTLPDGTVLTSNQVQYVGNGAPSFTIAISSENGTTRGAGTYSLGSIVTIEAIPNYGCNFQKWSDGNSDNPRTIVVTEDMDISAEILRSYKVKARVDSNSCGMGEVMGSGTYYENSVATIEAVPNKWYKFLDWSDGNSDNPRSITVTKTMFLSANFVYKYYINEQPTEHSISVGLNEVISGVEYMWYVESNERDITKDLQSTGSYAWTKNSNGVWTSGNKNVNNSSSTLSMNITAKAGDKLTFDYSVSSESGYDYLKIYLGNNQIGDSYSGSASGKFEYTFESDMNTTLKFVYSKDGSQNDGSDQATISNVIFEGEDVETLLLDGEVYRSVSASTLEIGKYYYCEVVMPDGTVLTSDRVQYEGGQPTAIEQIGVDDKRGREGIYDIMGRKLSVPQRGINIINGKKVIVR